MEDAMGDGKLDFGVILQEIRDELKENNKQISEINTRLAVLDAYNVPKIAEEIGTTKDRLTALETKLKVWASGAAFVGMILGLLIQEVLRGIWPNSH
jgi:hypothetical protein